MQSHHVSWTQPDFEAIPRESMALRMNTGLLRSFLESNLPAVG